MFLRLQESCYEKNFIISFIFSNVPSDCSGSPEGKSSNIISGTTLIILETIDNKLSIVIY